MKWGGGGAFWGIKMYALKMLDEKISSEKSHTILRGSFTAGVGSAKKCYEKLAFLTYSPLLKRKA